MRDAIAEATRASGRELEGQAERAIERNELPADTEPAELIFALSACAARANTVYELFGDRRAFEHARRLIASTLG